MLKINLIALILLIALLLSSDAANAQTATNEQITELLEIMKAEEQFIASMEAMVNLQKDNPQTAMLPEGFYGEFIKEAKADLKLIFYLSSLKFIRTI